MSTPRSCQSKTLKTGKETFRVRGEDVDITILDYWRWAYSVMLDNTVRGVLAEFLVSPGAQANEQASSRVGCIRCPNRERN